MNLLRYALLASCLMACVPAGANAQANQWDKPLDLKPLIPPVVPLPRNSQLNPGSVGGNQTPYTTAPLQNPNLSPTEPAPGLKLTIPAR